MFPRCKASELVALFVITCESTFAIVHHEETTLAVVDNSGEILGLDGAAPVESRSASLMIRREVAMPAVPLLAPVPHPSHPVLEPQENVRSGWCDPWKEGTSIKEVGDTTGVSFFPSNWGGKKLSKQECWDKCSGDDACEQAVYRNTDGKCWLGTETLPHDPGATGWRSGCEGCVDSCFAKNGFGYEIERQVRPGKCSPWKEGYAKDKEGKCQLLGLLHILLTRRMDSRNDLFSHRVHCFEGLSRCGLNVLVVDEEPGLLLETTYWDHIWDHRLGSLLLFWGFAIGPISWLLRLLDHGDSLAFKGVFAN